MVAVRCIGVARSRCAVIAVAACLGALSGCQRTFDASGCNPAAASKHDLVVQCTRAIESNGLTGTDLANAFLIRGNAWRATGDYDRAIDDYNEAAQLAPQEAVIFHNRGNAWLQKDEYARAKQTTMPRFACGPDTQAPSIIEAEYG